MDFTKTGVVIKSQTTKDFEKLIGLLLLYKPEERTVQSWNYLREEYKKDYDSKVISMLDASGFITKWLKG